MKINITSNLIKKLRSRTGAGFLECKRALMETNGNLELSIDSLRKSGIINAEKKINNVVNQGVILSKIDKNIGVMIELNCETDFVSKDNTFKLFAKNILSTALEKKIKKIEDIKDIYKEQTINLISKFGENIKISRFCFMEGQNILSYVHASRIGVLIDSDTSNNIIILKNIAMHVAASKPEYLEPKSVCNLVFERERQIQLELIKNIKKPSHVLDKIIEGKMNKFVNNISLTTQKFIMDTTKTVGELLNENNMYIRSFIRFELGETIS